MLITWPCFYLLFLATHEKLPQQEILVLSLKLRTTSQSCIDSLLVQAFSFSRGSNPLSLLPRVTSFLPFIYAINQHLFVRDNLKVKIVPHPPQISIICSHTLEDYIISTGLYSVQLLHYKTQPITFCWEFDTSHISALWFHNRNQPYKPLIRTTASTG